MTDSQKSLQSHCWGQLTSVSLFTDINYDFSIKKLVYKTVAIYGFIMQINKTYEYKVKVGNRYCHLLKGKGFLMIDKGICSIVDIVASGDSLIITVKPTGYSI